ncbi:MAG: putative signal transduction protein with Nacht domain [Candidatus Brocadiaceae bacterium]|nr:putative signal transduction protein with Nacht domain [Candidatus Brocadiaceae bacterium]
MKDKKEITVFIASPGDVTEERNIVRSVCEGLNKSALLKPYNLLLQATGWEDAFPSPGRPQEIINRLVKECDLFICIFHKRFGSPTGKEASGTLEEFLLAYDDWKTLQKPHIMFYFKEASIRSKKEREDPQLAKVLDFKDTIETEKLLLYHEFSTIEQFKENIKDHLEGWISEHAKWLGAVGGKILETLKGDKIFSRYLKSAATEHRHLSTKGFETNLRMPIELDRVYVNMRAYLHPRDFDLTLKGRKDMEERHHREELSSLDIKVAFKVSDKHRVKVMVILGDPGSGKTTLLKYILVSLADGRGEEILGVEDMPIPFFAPLRELKDPDGEEFSHFITRICKLEECSVSVDSFQSLLNDGRGIVLLDGLDEVANEDARIKTCKWIDTARKRYASTRFIITSRYAGYLGKSRLEGGVLELSLQPFTQGEVREFLVKWFELVEVALHPVDDEAMRRKKGRDSALALVERIRKSPHIERLAVNPLLLQIIALVHRDRGTLPQRRVELYEECTNILLEKWDMAKGLDVLITAREARQILQPLALWLHEVDERRSASMEDIKKVIKEPLECIGKSDIDPEKLLSNIRDRSGIFMGYSETEYGFTHHSFQEYLAAEQARNKGLIELLIKNYGSKWWREVILLCLGLNNPSIIEGFMEQLIPTEGFKSEICLVEDAIRDSIVKPSAPFIKAIENLELSTEARNNAIRILKEIGGDRAIHALKEAVKNKDQELAMMVSTGATSICGGVWLKKSVSGGIPERITNPVDGSEMVLIPAGTFLYGSREDDPVASSDEKPQRVIGLPAFYMDVFPVTNEQFCAFLNATRPSKKKLARWIDLKGSFAHQRCRIKKGTNAYNVEKGYEKHPAIYVSWQGANEYTKWAGKRLPTELEWEKAARGPDGRKYPWGNTFNPLFCNSRESSIRGITEVGEFPEGKSYYGCLDMGGNVFEWTDSWYGKENKFRVVRGGSWFDVGDYCRCASRGRDDPLEGSCGLGFRCARTL